MRYPILSRRDFLGTTATSLAAVGLANGAWAAKPIERIGKPYMKLSLAAYSFNRFLPKNWPSPRESDAKMTLLDFIDFCAEMDLDGTELTSYYFPKKVNRKYLTKIKEKTFRLGLDISGTAIGNDFCLPNGEARDAQLEATRQWIDHAAFMGAPVIRIFAGRIPKGETEEIALDRCVAGINESVAYAAKKGVVLALENHGGITSTPQQILAIIERVDDSPFFGVNFDSGNFRTADPYGDLEQIAQYAVNAQVKVEIARDNGKKEHADLKRVINILKQANYRGYIVLEYEEKKDPRTEIPKYLDQLRELIAI